MSAKLSFVDSAPLRIQNAPFADISTRCKYAKFALLIPSNLEDCLQDVMYEMKNTSLQIQTCQAEEDSENSFYVVLLELNTRMTKKEVEAGIPWEGIDVKSVPNMKKAEAYIKTLTKAKCPAGTSQKEWEEKNAFKRFIRNMSTEEFVSWTCIQIEDGIIRDTGKIEITQGRKYPLQYKKLDEEEELDRAIEKQLREDSQKNQINDLKRLGLSEQEALTKLEAEAERTRINNAEVAEQHKIIKDKWLAKQEAYRAKPLEEREKMVQPSKIIKVKTEGD